MAQRQYAIGPDQAQVSQAGGQAFQDVLTHTMSHWHGLGNGALDDGCLRILIGLGFRRFSVTEHALLCRMAELDPANHPHGLAPGHVNAQLNLIGPPPAGIRQVHFLISVDHVEYLCRPQENAHVAVAMGTAVRRLGARPEVRDRPAEEVALFHQALAVAGAPADAIVDLARRGEDVALAMEVPATTWVLAVDDLGPAAVLERTVRCQPALSL